MVEGPLEAVEGWPAALERGVAGAAIEGEARSGDLAVFARHPRGGLVAVIDGLGHGDEAADAAAIGAEAIRANVTADPGVLLRRCHEALRKSRGAVMTLAWFDLERRTLAWAGVGNVEARLVRGAAVYGDRHDSALVLGGVVGFNLPPVRPLTMELLPGDAVAFATDGIEADYSSSLTPGIPAQMLAERIFARHGKGTDDALAVVVRFLG
ncbi:MAG: phosphoserine phosphatase RsbX [Solirubrobacteraceae bacterium]|jgi:negative regulator of sigma-B (phosphoserine phosphatase)|nr:phosphoserine phosphatase RsbX [Solirubrobacteraceae bacterium]